MKWFLIVISLAGAEPKNYSVFFGEDEAECREAQKYVESVAKARGATVFSDCYQWKPPVIDKTKPNDKKSEVTS